MGLPRKRSRFLSRMWSTSHTRRRGFPHSELSSGQNEDERVVGGEALQFFSLQGQRCEGPTQHARSAATNLDKQGSRRQRKKWPLSHISSLVYLTLIRERTQNGQHFKCWKLYIVYKQLITYSYFTHPGEKGCGEVVD